MKIVLVHFVWLAKDFYVIKTWGKFLSAENLYVYALLCVPYVMNPFSREF